MQVNLTENQRTLLAGLLAKHITENAGPINIPDNLDAKFVSDIMLARKQVRGGLEALYYDQLGGVQPLPPLK